MFKNILDILLNAETNFLQGFLINLKKLFELMYALGNFSYLTYRIYRMMYIYIHMDMHVETENVYA